MLKKINKKVQKVSEQSNCIIVEYCSLEESINICIGTIQVQRHNFNLSYKFCFDHQSVGDCNVL
jgi:hypothetical protein